MDNLLRSALKDDFAAGGTAALSHLDDVIRLGDEFEAVFDDDDRVSVGNKFSEQGKKFFCILVVKTCGRLVENIDRALFVKFACKFYTLDFTARKRVGLARKQQPTSGATSSAVPTVERLETPMECWSTTTAGVKFSIDSTFARS